MGILSSKEIDDAGNDFEMWLLSADDLLASRDTLAKQRTDVEAASRGDGSPRVKLPEERSYWVEVMLVGFAVENLLKALWVRNGNPIYVNGRLQSFDDIPNHDLERIAGWVGFVAAASERAVLTMLSDIMVGIGRYPLVRRPDLQRRLEGWSNIHDDVVKGIIRRIREEIHRAGKA